MPEAQLAAEQLMLLPHVLLQVPKEAEGRPLRTAWALVLQQLPGETAGQPPTWTLSTTSPRERENPKAPPAALQITPGARARRAGTLLHQTAPGPEPDKAPVQEMDPHPEDGGYPQDDRTPYGVFPLQMKNLTRTSSGAPHRTPELPRHTPHLHHHRRRGL